MDCASQPTDCARKLRILADVTRLAVMKILLEGPKCVGELNAILQLEQSLLSHHLRVLRQEGFVKATRQGKTMLYYLDPSVQSETSGKSLDLGCCLLSFH